MPQLTQEIKNLFKNRTKYKTPLKFTGSTLFAAAINFVLGFVTFRYIAPDHLGIWGTFSTFTVYASFLRLGIPNGMNRELPYYYGKGDHETALKCASTTLSYSLFTTFIALLGAVVFYFCFDFNKYDSLSSDYFNTSIVFWITVLIEPYTTYLSGTYRTSDNFDKLSKLQIIKAVIQAITIVLLIVWEFNGYLIRHLIIALVDPIYLHVFRPIKKIAIAFDWSIFKKLFVVGFQLFIVSYISSFVDTLPRLYIIKTGSSELVGLFSPVIILSSMIYLIPNTFSQYLYPTFSFAYGKGYNRLYFWKKMRLILFLSLLIGLVAAIAAYFLVDWLLLLFPKYAASSACIKMACWGVAFIGYKIGNILCSIFKEWKWLYISGISYAVIQITTLLVVRLFVDEPLMVSSIAMSLTAVLMFFVACFIAYSVTHKKV